MSPPHARNAPCWCGSGVKFKRCHMRRASEKELPYRAIQNLSKRSVRVRVCLHPDASSNHCTKIIKAHSLQRSKLLEQIVSPSNKVCKLVGTPDKSPPTTLMDVGWRDASTFTGFCAVHDDQTFAPIEKHPFMATQEQCFLLAYRAMCHEVHTKLKSEQSVATAIPLMDRGKPVSEQLRIQSGMAQYRYWAELGKEETLDAKSRMDSKLKSLQFSSWSHWVAFIEGPLEIAATGVFTPSHDIDGRELQDFTDVSKPLQRMVLSVVPTDTGNAIILSWPAEARGVPKRYLNSILESNETELADLLLQVIFRQIENVYFSRSWWEKLPSTIQDSIRDWVFTLEGTGYATSYPKTQISPWRIVETLLLAD